MKGLISISDNQKGGPVVCPKPRRIGVLANNLIKPLRLHMSHQTEVRDSKAVAELLDIILKKEDLGIEQEQSAAQVASSPPFFCGLPPSRVANPLVQDVQFGDERLAQALSTLQIPSPSSSAATARKGGCVRIKFGLKPVAIRVEGFDCLNRDRQSSRIPAMA